HYKQWDLQIPVRVTLMMLVLYVSLACLRALLPMWVVFPPDGSNPEWVNLITRPMRIPGVIACWGLIYRLAQTPKGIAVGNYGGVAFFLHSAHFPLLAIIKIAVWKFMPGESDFIMLLHFALSVALTIMIGMGAGVALARVAPRFFALMNGGRALG